MTHKIYISFKAEDQDFKSHLQGLQNLDVIDKSLDTPINSLNFDYIMQRIRSDYLADSTVTVLLIGQYGSESRGWDEQKYIKSELQASLYNGAGDSKSGLLGVVLPSMQERIFGGSYNCFHCGSSHNRVDVGFNTTISEFYANYYIPNGKCAHFDDDRYAVLCSWFDFVSTPSTFINQAFNKRSAPIAAKTRVRAPAA